MGEKKPKDVKECCGQESEWYSVGNAGKVKGTETAQRAGGRDQLTRQNRRSSLIMMLQLSCKTPLRTAVHWPDTAHTGWACSSFLLTLCKRPTFADNIPQRGTAAYYNSQKAVALLCTAHDTPTATHQQLLYCSPRYTWQKSTKTKSAAL